MPLPYTPRILTFQQSIDTLYMLYQDEATTVAEYILAYEDLMKEITGVSELMLISFFINNLRPEIHQELLRRGLPSTLKETFALAQACEAHIEKTTQNHSTTLTNSSSSSPIVEPPFHFIPSTSVTPVTPATPATSPNSTQASTVSTLAAPPSLATYSLLRSSSPLSLPSLLTPHAGSPAPFDDPSKIIAPSILTSSEPPSLFPATPSVSYLKPIVFFPDSLYPISLNPTSPGPFPANHQPALDPGAQQEISDPNPDDPIDEHDEDQPPVLDPGDHQELYVPNLDDPVDELDSDPPPSLDPGDHREIYNKLLDPELCRPESSKLTLTCQHWDFFLLFSQDVPKEMRKRKMLAIEGVFMLPFKEKLVNKQPSGDLEGFAQLFVISDGQKLDWADLLYFSPMVTPAPTTINRLPPALTMLVSLEPPPPIPRSEENVFDGRQAQGGGRFVLFHIDALLLKACSKAPSMSLVVMIQAQAANLGCSSLGSVQNFSVQVYASCGDLCLVKLVFHGFAECDDVSRNLMLGGPLKWGCFEDALQVFDKISERDVISWSVMTMLCSSFIDLKAHVYKEALLGMDEEGIAVSCNSEKWLGMAVSKIATSLITGVVHSPSLDQRADSFYTLSWACNIDWTPFLVAGGSSVLICVINAGNEEIDKSLVGHGDSISVIRAQSLKPSLAMSASKDESVRLLNAHTGICILIIAGAGGHLNEISSVNSHSPDIYLIARHGMDNTLKIWSMNEFWTYVDKSYETFAWMEENNILVGTTRIGELALDGWGKVALRLFLQNEAGTRCQPKHIGRHKALKIWLEHNAISNMVTDDGGAMPMNVAASIGNKEIVNCFLNARVDSNIAVEDYMKPIQVARMKGCRAVAQVLLSLTPQILLEQVPPALQRFGKVCMQLYMPVIVAFQLFEYMIEYPTPTRAAVATVFENVVQRADVLMLSGGFAMCQYPFSPLAALLVIYVGTNGVSDSYTRWTFTLITFYFGLGSLVFVYGCYQLKTMFVTRGMKGFLNLHLEDKAHFEGGANVACTEAWSTLQPRHNKGIQSSTSPMQNTKTVCYD